MILTDKSSLDARFNPETGRWIFIVPFGLDQAHLENARQYVLKVNRGRLIGASPTLKHMLEIGISALVNGMVDQMIISKGDVNIFKSTQRENTNRSIVDLGGKK